VNGWDKRAAAQPAAVLTRRTLSGRWVWYFTNAMVHISNFNVTISVGEGGS